MSLKVTSGSLEGQECVFTSGNKMFWLPLQSHRSKFDTNTDANTHRLYEHTRKYMNRNV